MNDFLKLQDEGRYNGTPSIFINLDNNKDAKNNIDACLAISNGKFLHPVSNEYIHLIFSGEFTEQNQKIIVNIIDGYWQQNNVPYYITIQTNGSFPISEYFYQYFNGKVCDWNDGINKRIELLWSFSAINSIDDLSSYRKLSKNGQLIISNIDVLKILSNKLIQHKFNWTIYVKSNDQIIINECIKQGYKINKGNT